MTTAELRNAAREAEAKLDWSAAADLYEQAVSVYPVPAIAGTLAERDVQLLSRRAASCRWTANYGASR